MQTAINTMRKVELRQRLKAAIRTEPDFKVLMVMTFPILMLQHGVHVGGVRFSLIPA